MNRATPRPTRPAALPALLLVTAVLLSACAGSGLSTREDRLHRQLMAYANALRWGDFEAAAAMRAGQLGSGAVDPESLDTVRVSSYDVARMRVTDEWSRAEVVADLSYYHADSPTVHRLEHRQEWRWDETLGRWFLWSDLPAFR